jgi:hypothetical protein
MIKAVIFDMDGTLSESRQPISDEMIECLRNIPNSYKKYLVTGSDMAKIEEQIPVDVLLEVFDKVFACNGTRVYNTYLDLDDEMNATEPELIHKVSLTDFYSESDLNHIVNTLLSLLTKLTPKLRLGPSLSGEIVKLISLLSAGTAQENKERTMLSGITKVKREKSL